MSGIVSLVGGAITWETAGKTDVYPLLEDPDVRRKLLDVLADRAQDDLDYVAAPEATGMVFGSVLAERLGTGFIAVRRKDKWPFPEDELLVSSCTDYSETEKHFAVRNDQIQDDDQVMFFDDWIETGGQYRCVKNLLEDTGATVAQSLVIAIEETPRTAGLRDDVDSLILVE